MNKSKNPETIALHGGDYRSDPATTSVAVPLYRTKDNLPIGSMFSAAFGNENLLFSLAGQLEQAEPWVDSLNEMRIKLLETI